MKPYDCCVIIESAIELVRLQSDQEIVIAIILSTFYMRLLSGRVHVTRGEA